MSINSHSATRVNAEKGEALKSGFPEGVYEPLGRTFVLNPIAPKHEHYIAVVTAGTSDIPVAEEAAVTAETFGNHVNVFTTSELRGFIASSIVSKTSKALAS